MKRPDRTLRYSGVEITENGGGCLTVICRRAAVPGTFSQLTETCQRSFW